MHEDSLPSRKRALVMPTTDLEVVLSDDDRDPLSIVLPPADELEQISSLKVKQTSLSETFEHEIQIIERVFADTLEESKKKLDRFSGSPTFLNRLANLAGAVC